MVDKEKVLAGRKAVDAYRTAHTALYATNPHRRSIPEEHTPLLNIMLGAFKGLGFNTIQEFFDASELLNIQELGFKDRAEFESELAKPNIENTLEAKALREALDRKWR